MTERTLWKSSKVTAATAPRTREARALQASPTKSGTLKRRPRAFGSSGTSKCLWGNVLMSPHHTTTLVPALILKATSVPRPPIYGLWLSYSEIPPKTTHTALQEQMKLKTTLASPHTKPTPRSSQTSTRTMPNPRPPQTPPKINHKLHPILTHSSPETTPNPKPTQTPPKTNPNPTQDHLTLTQ